tara:strand:+ start:4808 stop:5185 length:378 start_codon:yes stop_codon:yes gene_type:complete
MRKIDISEKKDSGLGHWWHQKLTAVALLPLTLWFLIVIPGFVSLNFEGKLEWLDSELNIFLLSGFFLIASYHMKLGLTVVIEDYIHNNRIKKILLLVIVIFTLMIPVLTISTCLYFNLEMNDKSL